jgi:hypothetical protein
MQQDDGAQVPGDVQDAVRRALLHSLRVRQPVLFLAANPESEPLRSHPSLLQYFVRKIGRARTLHDVQQRLLKARSKLMALDTFTDVSFSLAGSADACTVQARVQEKGRFARSIKLEHDHLRHVNEGKLVFTWRNVSGVADRLHVDFGMALNDAAALIQRKRPGLDELPWVISYSRPLLGLLVHFPVLARLPWLTLRAFGGSGHYGESSLTVQTRGAAVRADYRGHALELESVWRSAFPQPAASWSSRLEAGDSLKCALTYHNVARPGRRSGWNVICRSSAGLAGPFGGDVRFARLKSELQWVSRRAGWTFVSSLRGGALLPLVGDVDRFEDRFFIQGGSDLRGFGDLGPRAARQLAGGKSAVDILGGTLFYTASIRAVHPLPEAFAPLSAQVFANAGAVVRNVSRLPHREDLAALAAATHASVGVGLCATVGPYTVEYNLCHPIRFDSEIGHPRFQLAFSMLL